jgi:predicted amidophosphoribosyltransferase
LRIAINPRHLKGGPWTDGYALDIHTLGSRFLGNNPAGYPMFDTQRSAAGELLYKLKYRGDQTAVDPLADAAGDFVQATWPSIMDAIVPAPPSNPRRIEPVDIVAQALGARLNIPVCWECLRKVKETPQLKDISEYNKRAEALQDAFTASPEYAAGKCLLLFDDLYGSGATVGHIVEVLSNQGQAKAVYLLTLMTK